MRSTWRSVGIGNHTAGPGLSLAKGQPSGSIEAHVDEVQLPCHRFLCQRETTDWVEPSGRRPETTVEIDKNASRT
jgi:hypothetical protein